MLNQLVEYGQRIKGSDDTDALVKDYIAIKLVIDLHGTFISWQSMDKNETMVEALTGSKKGKVRLLFDKAEEVLNCGVSETDPEKTAKKHALFIEKLSDYRSVQSIKPVLLFYENGLLAAQSEFEKQISAKDRKGNIAFHIVNTNSYVHENDDVKQAIIANFEKNQQTVKYSRMCSICGKNPVTDNPHGYIKKLPGKKDKGDTIFISYNCSAFESYGLKGNLNSSICFSCAKNYINGLNHLLSNGIPAINEKSNKPYTIYNHRKNLSADSVIVFWKKSGNSVKEIDLIATPENHEEDLVDFLKIHEKNFTHENSEDQFKGVLDLPAKQNIKKSLTDNIEADMFYAAVLARTAKVRIAVRSWVEESSLQLIQHIRTWLNDICIIKYDYDTKQRKSVYSSISQLAQSCGVYTKNSQGNFMPDFDRSDNIIGTVSDIIWTCALTGNKPPISLLDKILRRIKSEQGHITLSRIALIRMILNRNGGINMKECCDESNTSTAYIAGRLFAVMVNIQESALGKDLNTTIRDRFFSPASTTPASAFGRLAKMSQNHLSKIRGTKPWLAIFFDKELAQLHSKLECLPTTFTLEEQGQFVIGFYHQRQEAFAKNEENKKGDE